MSVLFAYTKQAKKKKKTWQSCNRYLIILLYITRLLVAAATGSEKKKGETKIMEQDNMFMGNRSQNGNKYNPNNGTANGFNFETTLSEYHALNHHHHQQRHSLYAGDGSSHIHQSADPHLVCLKLGKRHYFDGSTDLNNHRHSAGEFSIGKKGKPYYDNLSGEGGGLSSSTVPRCQVEGCNVTLVNAKDYHRRHKVCETHSKAPKVVMLGLEQRFCQQCSRYGHFLIDVHCFF